MLIGFHIPLALLAAYWLQKQRRTPDAGSTQPEVSTLDPLLRQEIEAEERACGRAVDQLHLRQLVQRLQEHSPALLTDKDPVYNIRYLTGLRTLAELSEYWVWGPETWLPDEGTDSSSFSSLARHLLGRYPFPASLDELLLRPNPDARRWYVHVAQGGNLREAPDFPVLLTRKAAHLWTQTPIHLPFAAAVRWAQVRAAGGDEALWEAIRHLDLTVRFSSREEEAFYWTLFQWLARQGETDRWRVYRVVAWARLQSSLASGFSLSGRTFSGIEKSIQEEEARNARALRRVSQEGAPDVLFPAAPYTELVTAHGGKWWLLERIPSARSLRDEGAAMEHCVADYAGQALEGDTSFWSLKVDTVGGLERAVTVQVEHDVRCIVEARGLENRSLTEEERAVLQLWAEQNGLTVSLEDDY